MLKRKAEGKITIHTLCIHYHSLQCSQGFKYLYNVYIHVILDMLSTLHVIKENVDPKMCVKEEKITLIHNFKQNN